MLATVSSIGVRVSCRMPGAGAALRAQLRKAILKRIDELNLKDFEAANELGLTPGQPAQMQEHVFSLERWWILPRTSASLCA